MFLKSCHPATPRNSLPFMEPESSLICSRKHVVTVALTTRKLQKARKSVITLAKVQLKLLCSYSVTESKHIILKTMSHPLQNL